MQLQKTVRKEWHVVNRSPWPVSTEELGGDADLLVRTGPVGVKNALINREARLAAKRMRRLLHVANDREESVPGSDSERD